MLKWMMKNLKQNKNKGFTLIELIVVIAIVALLSAVLVPSMIGYLNRARQTTADANARSVYAAATTAASICISSGEDVSTITNKTYSQLQSGSVFEKKVAEMLGPSFDGTVTVNVNSSKSVTDTVWKNAHMTGTHNTN